MLLFWWQGFAKRVKDKTPLKPPSGDRDDEGEGKQGSKSLRLADFSPPPNVVQVKDKSNLVMVRVRNIEEKYAKESNKDYIAVDMAAVWNKDLFFIYIQGVTTYFFFSQSLVNNQEPIF